MGWPFLEVCLSLCTVLYAVPPRCRTHPSLCDPTWPFKSRPIVSSRGNVFRSISRLSQNSYSISCFCALNLRVRNSRQCDCRRHTDISVAQPLCEADSRLLIAERHWILFLQNKKYTMKICDVRFVDCYPMCTCGGRMLFILCCMLLNLVFGDNSVFIQVAPQLLERPKIS